MGSVMDTQNKKCWQNTNFGVSKYFKKVLIFSLTWYYILIRNISIKSSFIWGNIKNKKQTLNRQSIIKVNAAYKYEYNPGYLKNCQTTA